MSNGSESGAGVGRSAEGGNAGPRWDVAKWLIPSVTALFVVVGYVAGQGHYALLGFDPGFLGTTQYSAITAEFLGGLTESMLNGAAAWPYLLTRPRLLFAIVPALLLCAIFTYAGRRTARASNAQCPTGPGTSRGLRGRAYRLRTTIRMPAATLSALLLVLSMKGLLLDAAVFKLEGALVTLGESSIPGSAPYPLQARLRKEARDGGLAGFAASNAIAVWSDLMCRRVDRQALHSSTAHVRCTADRTSYAHRIQAEFLAHVLATLCVAWLAVLLLARSRRVPMVSVAWLALLYCLTLPYAYGKLTRSTEYQFGEFAFKTQVDFGTDDVNRRLVNGFEVVRDSGTITIATLRVVSCGGGKSRRDVKLWRVALSEVLWQREIFRDDILGWKLAREGDDCPSNKPF